MNGDVVGTIAADEAAERFGIAYKTAKQAAWVAREFERSSRLDLSFGHHDAVAGRDDALALLAIAAAPGPEKIRATTSSFVQPRFHWPRQSTEVPAVNAYEYIELHRDWAEQRTMRIQLAGAYLDVAWLYVHRVPGGLQGRTRGRVVHAIVHAITLLQLAGMGRKAQAVSRWAEQLRRAYERIDQT